MYQPKFNEYSVKATPTTGFSHIIKVTSITKEKALELAQKEVKDAYGSEIAGTYSFRII